MACLGGLHGKREQWMNVIRITSCRAKRLALLIMDDRFRFNDAAENEAVEMEVVWTSRDGKFLEARTDVPCDST